MNAQFCSIAWPMYVVLAVAFLCFGCDDECDTCKRFSEGFIIGYQPCAVDPVEGYSRGYIVCIPS